MTPTTRTSGSALLQRQRDARGEPAAADRDQHRLRVRHLLGELEPDRPLAGDHALVLERVDERRAGPLDVRLRGRDRLLEALAGELGRSAVRPRRLDLRHRRVLRHEDRRRDPGLARRPRDRLAVVAGARGDDAGARAPRRRASRCVLYGAADLERAGALEVLGLEVHLAPGEPRERLRRIDRRLARDRRRAARARPRCQRSSAPSSSNTFSMISRTAVSGSSSRSSTRVEHAPQLGIAGHRGSRCAFARSTRPRTPRRRGSCAAAPRGGRRSRARRGAPRAPPRARARSRPSSASVRTIAGRSSRLREREDRAHLVQHRLRRRVIHLVDRDHVGDLHDPGLQRLHRVARAGHEHEQDGVRDPRHLDLALPRADRLDEDDVLAGRVEQRARACSVASASPPRCPRVPIERMKTPGSRKWSESRIRSPSSAPCENGLDGSTETTPTVCSTLADVARRARRSGSTCRRRAGR